jgi:osmoprotectant transport system substrate-binding protein
MSRSKRGIVASGILIASASLILAGCSSSGGSPSAAGCSSTPKALSTTTDGAKASLASYRKTEVSTAASGSGTIIVGNAGFSENVILADIYGQALANDGYTIVYKNAGDRTAYVPALENGEINLIPDYSGSILNFLDSSAKAASASDVYSALKSALASKAPGLVALTPASAADSDTITVTAAYAKAHNLKTIGDLKNVTCGFTLGASQQFQTRPDGIKGLESIYGVKNLKFKAINDGGGPNTLKALLSNQIQAADIYSTTPTIVENHLVSLQDPKSLFASQEVVPIITKSLATSQVTSTLDAVDAKLTTADLLKLNEEVAGASKTDPAVAAKNWLTSKGLLN